MYKGFNLSVTNDFFEQSHRGIGEYLHATNKRAIKESLDSFLGATGKVDAGKLQEHWFPQIKADVFISHSHRDRDVAMMLAGWLSTSFGLKTFIDSCVWGYANDLLREIDDKYCRLPIEGLWYDYLRCNGTSAHVHMMLAAALHTMIDSTECLIFLNTPNSISSEEAASTTASPWIYMEIMITRFIRKMEPRDHRERKFAAKMEAEFVYPAKLDHLIPIDHKHLRVWQDFYGRYKKGHALDSLYGIPGGV